MNHRTRKRLARDIVDRFRGRQRLHFIHIGKTGGTAIKAALPATVTPRYRILLHNHDTTLGDIPAGDKLFFFVRDPLSRFVSAFYSRQRQGRPRYQSPWSADEEKAFSTFATPNELGEALGAPGANRVAMAQHAMNTIQHVRDSYWDWFIDSAHLEQRRDSIFYIGSQENLGADFRALCLKLGLGRAAELPTDPVQAHRNPSAIDRRLSDRAVGQLAYWYRREYEFLGFIAERFTGLPSYDRPVAIDNLS